MRLSKALQEKLHDVRLRDKLLAEGKISQQDLDQYFKNLVDDETNHRELVVEQKDRRSS